MFSIFFRRTALALALPLLAAACGVADAKPQPLLSSELAATPLPPRSDACGSFQNPCRMPELRVQAQR